MLTLALLLATSTAAPQETVLLDAFRAACQRIDDFEAAKGDAAGAGWEETPNDADPRVARLLQIGREAVGGEAKLSGATYRRTIERRTVWLVLSRYEDGAGLWGNGCRAFDFDAPAPIAAQTADQWMGRLPGATDAAEGVRKRVWQPGWREGVSVEVNYVPAGGAVAKATGLSGNVLVAQAFGEN